MIEKYMRGAMKHYIVQRFEGMEWPLVHGPYNTDREAMAHAMKLPEGTWEYGHSPGYPNPVRHDSRIRVGIEWFATEAEAMQAAAYWKQEMATNPGDYAGVNSGFVQVGRDPAFDTYDDNDRKLYAVVIP